MKDSTVHELFDLLNVFVLKRSDNGTFQPLGSIPEWFLHLFPEALEPDRSCAPEEWSPFLENFLFDANEFWNKNKKGRTFSGPWIEKDSAGREFSLEASAVCLKDGKFFVVENLSKAYEVQLKLLQVGRDNSLYNELLEEEVRKRTAQIQDREEEVALRLVSAAEFRDDETGAHIRRMGAYSAVLAKKLGWSSGEIDNIRIAAPMHDIGKIGIPDSVLLKPGRLTDEEYDVMKQHAEIGGKMLAGSKTRMINMAHDIALYHHEKWDGSGYPSGLPGDEIPLSARVVAVADVYDALVHKRVYKPPLSEVETLGIMKKTKGHHFDPNLIDIFLDSLEDFRKIAAYDGSGKLPIV